MAEMHDAFIDRLSESYDNEHYVESVWYCYAIFEQRINRLIIKCIDKCPVQKERSDKRTVAISTRIGCIKDLISAEYGAFEVIDISLMDRLLNWCNRRNELVHHLLSFDHYKSFDVEFRQLAHDGIPLVFELYDACTDFRNTWYRIDETEKGFPKKSCRCTKNKCLNPHTL